MADQAALSPRAAQGDAARDRLVMLVYHEPTLDPRVDYTAASLAKRYDLTIVATTRSSEARPASNQPAESAYTTVRLPYAKLGILGTVRALAALLVDDFVSRRTFSSAGASIVRSMLLPLSLVSVIIAVGVTGIMTMPLAWLPADTARSRSRRLGSRIVDGARGIRAALSVVRFAVSASDRLERQVDAERIAPAVVYCHDMHTLQAGVRLKRRTGARLVYDSHEYYPYQFAWPTFVALVRRYEALLVRWVDVYITVTPQLAAELTATYRITCIHAVPNVEPHPPQQHGPPSEMSQLANGRLKILYQGSFAEERGLEEIIDEWRGVDPAKAALFLRGPRNAWLDQLERMAANSGLLGRTIYILPPVLERHLIAAAREADIGLIPYKGDWPSYRLACPNKLSQYIHAGLVVVSNRIPYVEQIVREGELGECYDVSTRGSFSAVIAALATDTARLETLKANARAFSRTEYNWERFEDGFLDLVGTATPMRVR